MTVLLGDRLLQATRDVGYWLPSADQKQYIVTMGYLVGKQDVNLSSRLYSFSRSRRYTTAPVCSSNNILPSSKAYSGPSLHVGSSPQTQRSGSNLYGKAIRAASKKKGEVDISEVEMALKRLVVTSDEGLPGQGMIDIEDVDLLRAALVMAHHQITVAESEKAKALNALTQAEAKQQEYEATLAQAQESAQHKLQATKQSYEMELQSIMKEKLAGESHLALAKQDAIDLAVHVDRVASSLIQEQAAQLAREAHLKIASAETTAAEAAVTIEERIKSASLETTDALLRETRDVIEKSLAAWDAAKDKAQKSELILFQKMKALDDLVLKEASALGLQQATSGLTRQIQAAEGEIQQLQAEVRAVTAGAEVPESHNLAAHELLKKFKEMADRDAEEHEGKAKQAMEALKLAGAARLEAARTAFKADIEALQAALDTVQRAEKSQEQAYTRRYQALERSLSTTEALAKAWEKRASAVEELLQQGVEDNEMIEGVLSGGRMETLLGKDSRKWDLIANGPRMGSKEWMVKRMEAALQGLPPRTATQAQEEGGLTLQLPAPDEVWSIASAKVKEDVFTKQAAEKEAIDEQRRVLEKTLKKQTVARPQQPSESGTGSGREIVFQGFNWESWRKKWYLELEPKAADLAGSGITTIWFPPPTQSVSPQGYMPGDLYNLNSAYGTEEELKSCIEEMHKHGLLVLGDVVLNHRCAQFKGPNGVWNVYGGKLAWGPEAIVRDDPNFQGRGNPSNGDFFHAAPNIDHSQDFVRRDIQEWMKWLKTEIGYDGWRLDFVRGFWGGYVKEYIEATEPAFAIGEYWDSLAYEGGNCSYNQDAHRQRIVNWVNATGGTSSAFDVTTKGILHSALHNEYWRLIDPQGKPPGVVGWWPSRAVTFLENHDTGSTQGHWPFPRDKLMQGYAYILTHPGTPVIFYDHFYDFGLHDPIAELIAVRNRTGVHCRSTVKIYCATNQGYVAQVGPNLVMKLGHLDWNPSKQNNLEGKWQRCLDKGSDYQMWERI